MPSKQGKKKKEHLQHQTLSAQAVGFHLFLLPTGEQIPARKMAWGPS